MDRFDQASCADMAPGAGSPNPSSRSGDRLRQHREGGDRALVLGLDAECVAVVCEVLSTEFETRMTNALQVALGLLASREYEAIIIDASIATDVSLSTLLAHVRSAQPAATILVTSQVPLRSGEIVGCFNVDADEYLPAPFHPRELLARVQRGVRRAQRLRTIERIRPRDAIRPAERHAAYQHGAPERELVATARAS